MELRAGAAKHPSGDALWARIEREALALVRRLPFGEPEARRAGEVLARLAEDGEPIGVEDVMIGATALEHGLVVVTRNARRFTRIPGLAVESWWE